MSAPSNDRSVDQWVEWLQACLSGEISRQELELGRDEELHEALIGEYVRASDTNRRRFGQALRKLLGSVPLIPTNAEIFFRLLQVVAVVKPVGGDATLKRMLAEGVVASYEYAGRPLRNTLLSVAAQYPVDEWLTEFLWKTADASDDFLTPLVCFRCLSFRMDDSHLDLLPKLISHLDSEVTVAQLSRQLFAAVNRNHCRGLRRWYIDHEEWICNQIEPLRQGFVTALLDTLTKVEELDDYAPLLLAEVRIAQKSPIKPEALIRIASMEKRMAADVRETLSRLQQQWHRATGEYLWFVKKFDGKQFRNLYFLTDKDENFAVALDPELAPILGNSIPSDIFEPVISNLGFGVAANPGQA